MSLILDQKIKIKIIAQKEIRKGLSSSASSLKMNKKCERFIKSTFIVFTMFDSRDETFLYQTLDFNP